MLQSFLPLFAMTFFIVLFIVLMQFLWKNIDDLVGKGLEMSVLAELFFYAALTLVPLALPLAILLASLMTFGNLGEKFELTAMKASGVSLLKAMSPLIVFISGIAVVAFFFQNDVLPHAQVKMYTLLFSARQKSPELEIPEGVFYDNIPGYNLFVREKNREPGMLHEVMIYDVSRGGDNSTILLADSGRLAMTPDMRYLYLHLFQGQQFENLREQKSMDKNVPFRREEFAEKEVLIPFDANFNRLDESGMRRQYVGKNMKELNHSIDSIGARLDSTGTIYSAELKRMAFPNLTAGRMWHSEEEKKQEEAKDTAVVKPIDIDTLITSLPTNVRENIFNQASSLAQQQVSELQFKSLTVHDDKRIMRRHEIELLKKFTLSVACLVFFFIGAPLGAIIRKGGLGTPLVISVLLFLFYYIIDNTGYKMARDGRWVVWCGIWLSTFILAPLGIYVTYKAMNDSSVFDADRYKALFSKLIGRKVDRKVNYKEVIINDISTSEAIARLSALREMALAFVERYSKRQSYMTYWKQGYDSASILQISETLEEDVEYMTDCRNQLAVNKLMDYPVVRNLWVYHPGQVKWLGTVGLWVVIVGFPVYLLGLKAQKNLKEEMRRIATVSTAILDILEPKENK
ncbi:MAG: LptF/LptG family permease [Muribaculaceae bacterium]|nr:LptF/LptG family permease [Muribaculaceae bacterium]